MAKKLSQEEWEHRVKEAGAGRYEFVRWAIDREFGATKKCTLRCIVDGYVWSAKPNHLLNSGSGCPKCKSELTGDRTRLTPESYIERLPYGINFIKWDDNYKGCRSLMVVSCENGHTWKAKANNIIHGMRGCPRCAKYVFQLDKTGYLYALRSECGFYVKIGISNNPSRRHKKLERSTPFSFSCIEQISGDGAKIAELEKYLHNKYERAGFVGFDGCTEWLICTPELLEELRKLGD